MPYRTSDPERTPLRMMSTEPGAAQPGVPDRKLEVVLSAVRLDERSQLLDDDLHARGSLIFARRDALQPCWRPWEDESGLASGLDARPSSPVYCSLGGSDWECAAFPRA
jgi:hypothetical protein